MITDQMLAEASAELLAAILRGLPEPEECTHQFSAEFERKMKRVIRRGSHPVGYRMLQRVAGFILVIFLSFMTLLAVSPTVRAAVIGWIREQCGYYMHYYFADDRAEQDPAVYSLSYVPDGYRELRRIQTQGNDAVLYEKETTKEILYFTYSRDADTVSYFLEGGSYTVEQITVNGASGEFYLSESGDMANCIRWSQEDTFFSISGFCDKNEFLKIAENIKK